MTKKLKEAQTMLHRMFDSHMTCQDDPRSLDFYRAFFGREDALPFRVDVRDAGDHYQMDAELPGIQRDKVRLTLEDGVMTIEAQSCEEAGEEDGRVLHRERRFGSMRRAFRLEGVQEDAITAEYRDGILRISLPKASEPDHTREIAIA